MKIKILLVGSLLILVLLGAACAGQPTVLPESTVAAAVTMVPTDIQTAVVEDFNSLLEVLRTTGANVELGDEIEQPFFTVKGQVAKINGADVQVFVYDTVAAMEAEAAQVTADGSSIGTNMVNWVDPPHFYKLGRMIVLYAGQDQAVLDLLKTVLGPQFAGQ